MEEPDGKESNGKQSPDPQKPQASAPGKRTTEPETGSEAAEHEIQAEGEDGSPDLDELKARIKIKDNHIRELYEQITAARLTADEATASRQAGEEYIADLQAQRVRLKERIRDLEEELRGRRRRREGLERQVARLERELERINGEISRRDYLLERRAEEMEALSLESQALVARKEQALQDALRRVHGLERDLEEREGEAATLRATIEELKDELVAEQELRERLAEPANRLRVAIDLFNDSDQRQRMLSLSRTLGQPEVHVELGDGEEPPALLTFTWQGVTWQTYTANPGLAVGEPRVYLVSAGENLSGIDRQLPNARLGPGGRVLLGL